MSGCGLDEELLLSRIKMDRAAFEILYEYYVDNVYRFIYGMVQNRTIAEDLTSMTFESALQSIDTYQWRGYSLGSWLFKIARNHVNKYMRKDRLWDRVKQYLFYFPPESKNEYISDRLMRSFYQLSDSDREIIRLKFFDDLSNEEIAYIVNCSVETLYVRMHRAIGRLRKIMIHIKEGDVDAEPSIS